MAPIGKARARKPAIMQNRESALLKRNIVKLDRRAAMMGALRKRLKQPTGWFNMAELPNRRPSMRLFRFDGMKVVVKDTGGVPLQGSHWKHARADFLAHQKAVRSGAIKATKYILRSPKAYGLIGGEFLAMEYIGGKISSSNSSSMGREYLYSNKEGAFGPAHGKARNDFGLAMAELLGNLS